MLLQLKFAGTARAEVIYADAAGNRKQAAGKMLKQSFREGAIHNATDSILSQVSYLYQSSESSGKTMLCMSVKTKTDSGN